MTSVRIRPRTPGRVRTPLLAPAVIAIVLGILGMHGVDAHGVTMHGAMPQADRATPSSSPEPVHAPGANEGEPAHSTIHPGTSADDPGTGDRAAPGGMATLCVAILAGAVAALLALLARRGRPPRGWAAPTPAGRSWRPTPCVLRVGAGPPSAWRFSVIRC